MLNIWVPLSTHWDSHSIGAIAAAGTTTLRGTSLGAAKKDMLGDRSAAMAAATITMESTRRAMVHTADRSGATASLRRSRQTPTESQVETVSYQRGTSKSSLKIVTGAVSFPGLSL